MCYTVTNAYWKDLLLKQWQTAAPALIPRLFAAEAQMLYGIADGEWLLHVPWQEGIRDMPWANAPVCGSLRCAW